MMEAATKQEYKQTEMGLIPSDWEVRMLGEIGEVKMCRRIFNYETSSIGDIPFYKIGTFGKEADAFISKDLYNDYHNRFSFPTKGDILISAAGTIGRTIIYNGEDSYFQDSNIIWIENNQFVISNDLLFYTFQVVKYNTEGGTIQRLYNSILKSTKFVCPPLPEQKAIATALKETDELIQNLEELIAKKKLIKQGAMQELLKPKEGWVTKTLGEIGIITGAGIDKKINEKETPIRLLNYMDVFKRDFIYSNEINHWVTAPTYKIQQCSIKKGDIFFTPSSEMRFDIAISAIAIEDINDAGYSYHLVRLRLLEDWDLYFSNYVFKTKYFLSQAEQLCEGSGKRYVISLPKFRSMEVQYPTSKLEQSQIASVLLDIDNEIEILETKLSKYKIIKQGMMQQLLTGKIRLV